MLYFESQPSVVRYKLAHEWNTVMKTDRVDLLVLNKAPVELRYVIASGILVYEVDVKTLVNREALTLGLYGDFLPVLRN